MATALWIGAHNEEIEAEVPLLPQILSELGWRVVILNPVGCMNWVEIRRMTAEQRNRMDDDCKRAAGVLGAEKVIWELECQRGWKWRGELEVRLAEFLRELQPDVLFVHWPLDGHPDHRAVAQASLMALRHAQNLTANIDWQPNWREVWAFPAGIGQTYGFWPDVLVAADQGHLERAREALREFVAYGEAKQEGWWRNVVGKTTYWGALAGGRPAEAYKYVGPMFPARGTLLAEVLGERLVPVLTEPWQFERIFNQVCP